MPRKWSTAELPSRSDLRTAKRAALIRQAAKAFRANGFHATTMEEIAGAVGVTKGALYRYVENKQEILFECFKASNELGEAALKLAGLHVGSGMSSLRTFIVYFVEKYVEENTAGGAMVDLGALFPEQRAEIIAGRDRIDAGLRRLVRQGVADGSILERDAKLTVFTIMGSINWIPSWYSNAGPRSARQIAEIVADIFTRGLQTVPATQQGARPAARRGARGTRALAPR